MRSQPLVSSEGGHKVLECWLCQPDCSPAGPKQQLCSCDSAQAREQVSTPVYLAFCIRLLLGKTSGSQTLKESLESL